jgi:hypothetical protein
VSDVVTFHRDDFAGVAQRQGHAIHVALEGNADYATLDALEMLLARVHADASRLGATEAVVDLRRLEFMSSSCFKCFISWIADIRALEPEHQYKIRLISNPTLHWQKRSLHSLRCFAVELITVTESP